MAGTGVGLGRTMPYTEPDPRRDAGEAEAGRGWMWRLCGLNSTIPTNNHAQLVDLPRMMSDWLQTQEGGEHLTVSGDEVNVNWFSMGVDQQRMLMDVNSATSFNVANK